MLISSACGSSESRHWAAVGKSSMPYSFAFGLLLWRGMVEQHDGAQALGVACAEGSQLAEQLVPFDRSGRPPRR